MPRFSRITKQLLNQTVGQSDVNEALFIFQKAIGIDAGDVAGQVFGFGWGEEWPSAPVSRRLEMMDKYIQAERHYAQP